MVLEEQPDTLQLTSGLVKPANGTRADDSISFCHHKKCSIILEIRLLNIIQIMERAPGFVERDRFLQRTCIVEHPVSYTVDQVPGDESFVRLNAAYANGVMDFHDGHYNHLAFHPYSSRSQIVRFCYKRAKIPGTVCQNQVCVRGKFALGQRQTV